MCNTVCEPSVSVGHSIIQCHKHVSTANTAFSMTRQCQQFVGGKGQMIQCCQHSRTDDIMCQQSVNADVRQSESRTVGQLDCWLWGRHFNIDDTEPGADRGSIQVYNITAILWMTGQASRPGGTWSQEAHCTHSPGWSWNENTDRVHSTVHDTTRVGFNITAIPRMTGQASRPGGTWSQEAHCTHSPGWPWNENTDRVSSL